MPTGGTLWWNRCATIPSRFCIQLCIGHVCKFAGYFEFQVLYSSINIYTYIYLSNRTCTEFKSNSNRFQIVEVDLKSIWSRRPHTFQILYTALYSSWMYVCKLFCFSVLWSSIYIYIYRTKLEPNVNRAQIDFKYLKSIWSRFEVDDFKSNSNRLQSDFNTYVMCQSAMSVRWFH